MLPPIHVIDFEGNRAHGIQEYGLVTLKNNIITEFKGGYCNQPAKAFTPEFKEHSELEEGESSCQFFEHLPLFAEKRSNGLFCAHGAMVEDRLLRQYRLSPGKHPAPYTDPTLVDNPAIEATGGRCSSWGPWIDTYRLYKKYYPVERGYSVGDLIECFKLQKKLERLAVLYCSKDMHFHRSAYDSLATALLLQNFIEAFQVQAASFLFL
ncbi:MAG: hypothetical protein LBS71_02120 [Puniceicoccales bacterium]|jgi:hypothetical protein|nr:hypothetical protein [Puniceicoccales bacterium]